MASPGITWPIGYCWAHLAPLPVVVPGVEHPRGAAPGTKEIETSPSKMEERQKPLCGLTG